MQLSLDLKRVNFPSHYNIAFQIEDHSVNSGQCIVDSTSWLPIPPPEFLISTFPHSLILRPDDQRNIELFVNSTVNLESFRGVKVLLCCQSSHDVMLTISPNNAIMPSDGLFNSQVQIKVLNSASTNKTYVLPINASISLPSLQRGKDLVKFDATSAISITVLPPLSIPQYIDGLLSTLSPPIKGLIELITVVGGAISAAYFFIRQRQNYVTALLDKIRGGFKLKPTTKNEVKKE